MCAKMVFVYWGSVIFQVQRKLCDIYTILPVEAVCSNKTRISEGNEKISTSLKINYSFGSKYFPSKLS